MSAALVLAMYGYGLAAAPPSPVKAQLPEPARKVTNSIAVDAASACALQGTGKVSCWGLRGTHVPVEVQELDGVIGVAAGQTFTCAWTSRGAVACWGDDPKRTFGPSFDDVVQVSVGTSSACGLHATGRVSCWANGSGEAQVVAGVTDAVEIAGAFGVGAEKLCFRSRSGVVGCGNSVSPFEAIPQLAGATSLGGAGCRFGALLPGHRLATWVGWTGRAMPVFLDGVDAERVVVGGHLNGSAALCVLGTQAQCWAWAGESSLALARSPPLPAGVRDLSMDAEATCARVADSVRCWGRVGRLGDGEPEYLREFVPVAGIADALQLDAAGRTMCALRASRRVVCWGEQLHGEDEPAGGPAIDHRPVELPGVTDAVEFAMQGGNTYLGNAAAYAVCARRPHGATCWTMTDGQLQAADAPELAGAVKLFSGPAVCGVTAKGAVRCVRLRGGGGSVAGFSEEDYERIVYPGAADDAVRRVAHELEKRMRAALAAGRLPTGFHPAASKGTAGQTDRAFHPPVDQLTGVVQLRRIEWRLDDDSARLRGAVCARSGDGTIRCWGERDFLGAGLQSNSTTPVTPR